MDLSTFGLLALLLVCPLVMGLMMMLMMRGGHGGGSDHDSNERSGGEPLAEMTEEQLREIAAHAARELDERERRDHVAPGPR